MKQPELKSYPCSLCGSESTRKLYTIRGFNVVQCTNCSFVYINPRVPDEDLYRMYSENYFSNEEAGDSYGYENYELTAHLRIKTFHEWAENFTPYLSVQKGNVLDIGCASGYFLTEMKKRGWNVEGIELDTSMIKKLKEQNIPVYEKPFETFTTEKKYDLITLFDVIEHIPDLKTAFRKLHDLLSDNGIIVLITPDYSSRQRKFFGKRWFQFKPQEHIQYFTPATLRKAIAPFHLGIVHHRPSGQYADAGFLLNRLHRYGFYFFEKITLFIFRTFGLNKKSWYVGTGSMLAVIRKNG